VPVFIVPPGAEPAPAVQTAAARAPAPCILVALDDSDASSRALDFALDLALGGHARVICCSAIDTLDLRGEIGDYANDLATVVQEMTREAAALIDTKTARAAERGIALEKLVVEGSTVEAILDAAKAHRAGLIALGTHGRHGLQRLFLGSVAEHIVRRSPIPVVAVRVP
jgi:nucleotide-binding universal stress UspA family protein